MASPMLGIRCLGFEGWSLSGWSSSHLSQVGRRPTSVNDTPTWEKDAHLPKPPLFSKACLDFCDIEVDDDSDEFVTDSEDEAEDCDSRLRRCLTPYYEDLEEEKIREIEKYIVEVHRRLNGFPYEIKLAVPDPVLKRHDKTYACVLGCPVPFNGSVPLRESWKKYMKERDKLSGFWAIDDYNKRMGQDMQYESGVWAYYDTAAHAFFITFVALDNRTREYHRCLARVVHRFYIPPDQPHSSVSAFSRLPPQGHIEASDIEDSHCQHISLDPIRNYPSGSTERDHLLSMASASIREAISYFQRTTGIDLNFQRCHSVKFRDKFTEANAPYSYFYITFVAKAMDGTFYCDTKVRWCTQGYKVLSFSRRSEDGIYQQDKPYVDLSKPESLSLITECANAAVDLYRKEMDVYMGPPKVMMAYHSLSLGANAFHIRFKSLSSSGHVSICSATVIYDVDDVEDKIIEFV
ncbi:hypothetical protein Tsubulata_021245, partial [Turnera subulata]